MKTFTATPSDIERKWFVVDAEDVVLGRLAAVVANRLRGKHKAMFTPHMDCGDHIVIVNAEKVKLTGRKLQNKKFYWHTGYPGGIKERTMDKLLNGEHPERCDHQSCRAYDVPWSAAQPGSFQAARLCRYRASA